MKPNEAPEKLYIDSREHWRKSWTAFTTKAKGDDIEYIRKDFALCEAKGWLEGVKAQIEGVLDAINKEIEEIPL